jgi:hypothetical protein
MPLRRKLSKRPRVPANKPPGVALTLAYVCSMRRIGRVIRGRLTYHSNNKSQLY